MTRARANSFARTIRESMSELCRYKIEIPYVRAGLITRAALYRNVEWAKIERFLKSGKATATCMFSAHDKAWDYWPDHWMFVPSPSRFRLSVGVDLEADNAPIAGRVIFPIPTPLTVVGRTKPTDSQLDKLAK